MKRNLLKLLRGDKTQNEMANIYGVTQQTWFSWETGRTVPNNETMLKMEKDFLFLWRLIFLTLSTTKSSNFVD